jgi:hypothetical protein
MKLSNAYNELIANPKQAFVQDTDGTVMTWKDWICADVKRPDGRPLNRKYGHICLYPGSFNPLHAGHRDIFDNLLTGYSAFEISIMRWGKDALSLEDLETRLQQFVGYGPVVITNVARMIDKISLLGHSSYDRLSIEIGVDTMVRMIEDYGVVGIGGLGARFYIYDRVLNEEVQTMNDIFPSDFKPANCYRPRERSLELMTLSSTAIRNSQTKSK